MLAPGPAKKIAIHLNEDTSSRSGFLSDHILAVLYGRGVAGASVVRLEAGFGSNRRMHGTGSGIDADLHMPVRIEFIESCEMVEALLPLLSEMLTDGMIEAHDTTILKVAKADTNGGLPVERS